MKTHRLGFVLAIGAALSCQLVLGVDRPTGADRPDGGAPDPCHHADPPPAPDRDDDESPGAQKAYWLAFNTVSLTHGPGDAGLPGFDLDHSCTCQADPFDGSAPCNTPEVTGGVCDGDGGLDNGLGSLVLQYSSFSGVDPGGSINQLIGFGLRTALIYLGDYNGKANDRAVSIGLISASGLFTDLGCDGAHHDHGPVQVPAAVGPYPGDQVAPLWDGCDRWTTETGQVGGTYPNRIALQTVPGYVKDYTFVARVDRLVVGLFGTLLTLAGSVLVGHIEPTAGGFKAEGMIAGRMPVPDLSKVLAKAPQPDGTPICASPAWSIAMPIFCRGRDTMGSPQLDHQGQTCDAITGTLAFVALPVQIADTTYARPPDPPACPNLNVQCPAQ